MRLARIWPIVIHFGPSLSYAPRWLLRSREWTNFTYDYTALGNAAAFEAVALATSRPVTEIEHYAMEILNDEELKQWIATQIAQSPYRFIADQEVKFGRRLLYYLIVRACKPKVVVEAGTDKGMGACLIARALQRNQQEGKQGYLYALDLEASKGLLLGNQFKTIACLQFGDSVAFLQRFTAPIDLFIHDTISAVEHERLQYAALEKKLAANAITISTWYTEEFLHFVRRTGRRFVLLPESPQNHWYSGGKVPISFRAIS